LLRGVIPGLLLNVLYVSDYVDRHIASCEGARGKIQPQREKYFLRERVYGPFCLLFILLIGGISPKFLTDTEAQEWAPALH